LVAASWKVVGVFTAVLTGVATVFRVGGVVVEEVAVPDAMVRTGKVCEVCVPSAVSVAVTVTLV
jgi:hypothetical protein